MEEKKKFDGGKVIITSILVLVTAAVFMSIGYFAGTNVNKETSDLATPTTSTTAVAKKSASVTTTASATTVGATADWKTYTNEKYGYSFKYPKDWTYKSGDDGGIGFSEVGKSYSVEGAEIEPIYSKLELNGASDSTALEIATARKLDTDIGKPEVKAYSMPGFDAARGSDYLKTTTYIKLSNGNLFLLEQINNGVQEDQDRLTIICDQILSTFQFTPVK